MFQFEWLWVFLFLPLPAVFYFLLPKAKHESTALKAPFFHQVQRMSHVELSSGQQQHLIKRILIVLIWLSLILASARPQWVGDAIDLPASGRDLLVAVDISGSMETADMKVQQQQIQRIDVVKFVVGEFVKRRESDRLGLILFGTHAYLQSPLTFDRNTVDKLLQEAQLGFAGEKTAIGDAIGLAIKRLKERPESQRILVLLTDGANTAGEVAPRQAADLAKQAGIKIYTVGVGADQMTVRQGFFGNVSRTINPSADLDEDTLQYIAETTGGLYFRARNPQELQEIYGTLDELEPVEQEAEIFRPTSALFYWPLGFGLILSFLLALAQILPLPHFQRQRSPTTFKNTASGGMT